MSDDYLWDKKGDGAPSTKQLESVLGAARFAGMRLPQPRRRRWPAIVGGGLLALAAAALFVVVTRGNQVTIELDGVTRVLAQGEWLEPDQPATLALARKIGVVEVAPNSRLRLLRADDLQQRLELERGSLHAFVNAPPRLFVVTTPAGPAVDLGCEYELEVLGDRSNHLRVHSGMVELAGDGLTVTVYAGMWTRQAANGRPLVAIDDRASLAFLSAVLRVERDEGALPLILSQAGVRDGVTLLQLADRLPAHRAALEARFDELVGATPGEARLQAALRRRSAL